MRVIITGGTGLIGQELVQYFIQEGHTVVVPTRQSLNNQENLYYYQCDLTRDLLPIKDLKPHLVVHCAALVDTSNSDYNVLYLANTISTRNIVNSLSNCFIPLIYISSIGVIGSPKMTPINENHSLLPNTLYHQTKHYGEQEVLRAFSNCLNKDNHAGIFRISSPVSRYQIGSGFLTYLLNQCQKGLNINLYGTGSRVQNYISIKDIYKAIWLFYYSKAHGIYHLPGDLTISNLELAKLFIARYGSSTTKIFLTGVDPYDHLKWIISGVKAKLDFNYQPVCSVFDSIDEYIKNHD